MAKAIATCKCTTCGNTFEKIAYKQNRREADSWEEWAATYYDECDDCYRTRIQHERKEENAKAVAEAQENELPELIGSEKQIAWAIMLRQKAFNSMMERIASIERRVAHAEEHGNNEKAAKLRETLDEENRFIVWLFNCKKSAHWWIDHRDMCETSAIIIIKRFYRCGCYDEFKAQDNVPIETTQESTARKIAQQDMTVEPQDKHHDGAVDIIVTDTSITAKYQRNDNFRAIVKSAGYGWSVTREAWMKHIDATTGTARERAAELGNKLLNAGFAIRIADPDTRQAAIDGRYEPEHQRWITSYSDGKLCIRIQYGDGMYGKARTITGAKYRKPNIEVHPKNFEEIEDFASRYDYRFTPKARALIDAEKAKIVVVIPSAAKTAVYAEHSPREILGTSADVLNDLRED